MIESKFIVIEGNIGVGKTTLSTMLSEEWGGKLLLEEFEQNEYLQDFYTEGFTGQFQTELRFLIDRFHQLEKQLATEQTVVSDYFIEKSLIFAELNLNARDFNLFKDVYQVLFDRIRKPDLYVFLNADLDRIINNIAKRGRSIERSISEDYLKGVNNGYLKYVAAHTQLKVLVIDTSKFDFVNYPVHFEEIKQIIVDEIDATSIIQL